MTATVANIVETMHHRTGSDHKFSPRDGIPSRDDDTNSISTSTTVTASQTNAPSSPQSTTATTTTTSSIKQSQIFVAVRCRPLLPDESAHLDIVRVLDKNVVVVLDSHKSQNDILRINRSREKQYAFDCVFPPHTTQETVYEKTVEPLLDSVLEGYNASVFAYGTTNSGKTFTMLGSETHPGVMFQCLRSLFSRIENSSTQFTFKVILSYLEVYNENIRDLIHPSDEYLELREDGDRMHVVGLSEIEVSNVKDIMSLLKKGNRNRMQEPTAMNQTSSRSHAVLQVRIEKREKTRNTTEQVQIAKLSLIDLAGSERAAVSQNRGIRLLEGANINRSLLALGNCINALSQRNNKGCYVPYRDSKLTRLLKDSLGNCKTAMIACVSPSHITFEDTINTLKYANRAKQIRTKISRNIETVSHHIANYTKIIEDLRSEISTLKHKLIVTRDELKVQKRHNSVRDLQAMLPKSTSGVLEFNQLKKELILNFEEMMQARKSTTELEALEVENRITVNRLQIEISRLNNEIAESDTPNSSQNIERQNTLKKYRKEVNTLLQSMKRNAQMKSEFQEKYDQLGQQALVLKEKLKFAAQNNPNRGELLAQLFRLHMLELENTELSALQNKQHDTLREKDLIIQKLYAQLKLRDNIIAKQKYLLQKNGLSIDNQSIGTNDVISKSDAKLTPADPPGRNTTKSPTVSRTGKHARHSSLDETLTSKKFHHDPYKTPSPKRRSDSTQAYYSAPSSQPSAISPPQQTNIEVNNKSNHVSHAQQNHQINQNINIIFQKTNNGIKPSKKLQNKRLKRQKQLASIYGQTPEPSTKKKKKKVTSSPKHSHSSSPNNDPIFTVRTKKSKKSYTRELLEKLGDTPPSPQMMEDIYQMEDLSSIEDQRKRLLKHRMKRHLEKSSQRPQTLPDAKRTHSPEQLHSKGKAKPEVGTVASSLDDAPATPKRSRFPELVRRNSRRFSSVPHSSSYQERYSQLKLLKK